MDIIEASWIGDYDAVVKKTRFGVNVNAQDAQDVTALHAASSKGHHTIVQYLIEEGGALVDVPDEKGRTPLICGADYVEVLQVLCSIGRANIHAVDRYGYEALHYAALHGKEASLKYLLQQKGLKVNVSSPSGETPAMLASKRGHLTCLKALIQRGASPSVIDKDGLTALHIACFHGHLGAVKLWVDGGADLYLSNALTNNGPLHYAAAGGHVAVCRYILEHSSPAVLHDVNFQLETPLHLAALQGRHDAFALLLEKGADLSARTATDTSIFLACCQGRKCSLLDLLPASVITPQDCNREGNNGLHLAAMHGRLPQVQWLLNKTKTIEPQKEKEQEQEQGKDPNETTNHNHRQSLFHLEATNQESETALYLACFHRWEEVAVFLCEQSANPYSERAPWRDETNDLPLTAMGLARRRHWSRALQDAYLRGMQRVQVPPPNEDEIDDVYDHFD
jgi:ankyrin repeat protein